MDNGMQDLHPDERSDEPFEDEDRDITYTVRIDVTVHDKEDLFKAAMDRYLVDGNGTAEDAHELMKPGGVIDVESCLQMIFDPGMSPDGCDIQESSVKGTGDF